MVVELRARGIPSQHISGVLCSQTMQENMRYTRAILEPRGTQEISLVIDLPHLHGAFLEFLQQGLDVIPCDSSLPVSMSWRDRVRLVLRKSLRLLGYTAIEQLSNNLYRLIYRNWTCGTVEWREEQVRSAIKQLDKAL